MKVNINEVCATYVEGEGIWLETSLKVTGGSELTSPPSLYVLSRKMWAVTGVKQVYTPTDFALVTFSV